MICWGDRQVMNMENALTIATKGIAPRNNRAFTGKNAPLGLLEKFVPEGKKDRKEAQVAGKESGEKLVKLLGRFEAKLGDWYDPLEGEHNEPVTPPPSMGDIAREFPCTAREIELFSRLIAATEDHPKFVQNAGLFLSVLISYSMDSEFVIRTSHLRHPPERIGNGAERKKITVEGNAGDYAGERMERSTLVIVGNAGKKAGFYSKKSNFIVHGSVGRRALYHAEGCVLEVSGSIGKDACLAAVNCSVERDGKAIAGKLGG